MRNYTIWTDGSCLGNPGFGGWSAIFFKSAFDMDDPDPFLRTHGSELETTNNRMEMLAIIESLKFIPEGSHVGIVTDSSYCVDGAITWHKKWIERDWKGVANKDLWLDLLAAIKTHKLVEFRKVKGHSKIKWNEECDIIARAAAMARREIEETGNAVRFNILVERIKNGGEFDRDLARKERIG